MSEEIEYLDRIREKIGTSGRRTSWFKQPPFAFPEPHWLKGVSSDDDAVKNIFRAFHDIWKHGVVVWGFVIRANRLLYEQEPGDCPGLMIFSTTADDAASLERLPQMAERLWALREIRLPESGWTQKETEWWEDLQDDMSFQKGVKLPSEWPNGGSEYRGSCVMFHRAHLHGGMIQSRVLPLLVDPVSNYAQTIPCDVWPNGMAEWLMCRFPLPTALQTASETGDHEDAGDAFCEENVNRELLEEAYMRVFGPIVSVFHEVALGPDHIDVYRFHWSEPRNEHGYVTGGMSNLVQPNGGQFARIELVLYAKTHNECYLRLLRTMAHYPTQTVECIGPWHTFPMGEYAEQMVGTTRFAALLFFPGVAKPETPIHVAPKLEPFGIRYLTVVPITASELNLSLQQGIDALIERFDSARFDLAFDPARESLV
jgi:hypothetical protein